LTISLRKSRKSEARVNTKERHVSVGVIVMESKLVAEASAISASLRESLKDVTYKSKKRNGMKYVPGLKQPKPGPEIR